MKCTVGIRTIHIVMEILRTQLIHIPLLYNVFESSISKLKTQNLPIQKKLLVRSPKIAEPFNISQERVTNMLIEELVVKAFAANPVLIK